MGKYTIVELGAITGSAWLPLELESRLA